MTIQGRALDLLRRVVATRPDERNAAEIRVTEFLLLIRRCWDQSWFPPRRLLEVGCGNGVSAMLWALVGNYVLGVDLPEEVAKASRMLDAVNPSARPEIKVGDALDLSHAGVFDVIVAQYVLEHVPDVEMALHAMRAALAPGGHLIVIAPALNDRHAWYVHYRSTTGLLRRAWHQLTGVGALASVARPFGFTPPHAPEFGPYVREHEEYRLERWTLRLLMADFEVSDYFQTRDVNWVIVAKAVSDGHDQ